MIKQLSFLAMLFIPSIIYAQTSKRFIIRDQQTHEAMTGVVVHILDTNLAKSSDVNGNVIFDHLPSKNYKAEFIYIGYVRKTISFIVDGNTKETEVLLTSAMIESEEVIVSTTRTHARIEDMPVKVEVLGLEDMDEESSIVPGNVSSILGDLAIITVQRTNPANGNDAIRMQGLDAKYTQLLKDGLPLYGGFSGSLGVLSIPPLDLRQVEIIKGSSSTLYGGGAIGGLINFISKTPLDTPQTIISINASSLGEKNLNIFLSGKKNNTGFTLTAGSNSKEARDINNDGFAEVPDEKHFIFHPRLFFYGHSKAKLNIGITSMFDKRTGGDMKAIKLEADSIHTYLYNDNSFRNTIDLTYLYQQNKLNTFTFKTSLSTFSRQLSITADTLFKMNGFNASSYTELNFLHEKGRHKFVAGATLITDEFTPVAGENLHFSGYRFSTIGIFIQEDWQPFEKLSVQGGMRWDHHNNFGDFYLPRLAIYYKPSQQISVRLAYGSGYKIPNIFEVSNPGYQLTSLPTGIKAERSNGLNADVNLKLFAFKEVSFHLNQALYITNIDHPVVAFYNSAGLIQPMNADYKINSTGSDTYIKILIDELQLYLGYNHTEAYRKSDTKKEHVPFNPTDKFSTTVAYEVEGAWRFGLEASYVANQFIQNDQRVRDYWFWAAMAERKFKQLSCVLNIENITDTRQSKYVPLISGPLNSPKFTSLWGPVEGRVINLALKYSF